MSLLNVILTLALVLLTSCAIDVRKLHKRLDEMIKDVDDIVERLDADLRQDEQL